MIFQVQLVDEVEGSWIEIQTRIYTGRPAQQDAAHETLSPRQIVPPNQGIGFDVIVELLARRRAQADNHGLWRFRSQFAPSVRGQPS